MKRYGVKAWGVGCEATTTAGVHVIKTDTPIKDGGRDGAAEPVETLLAALVGCEQATAHFVARMVRPSAEIKLDFLYSAT